MLMNLVVIWQDGINKVVIVTDFVGSCLAGNQHVLDTSVWWYICNSHGSPMRLNNASGHSGLVVNNRE